LFDARNGSCVERVVQFVTRIPLSPLEREGEEVGGVIISIIVSELPALQGEEGLGMRHTHFY
jgi:hypothetical protein